MKKTLLLLVFILSSIAISAQDHSVTVKLLSSEPSRIYANVYHANPSYYEYDSENRVCHIIQTNRFEQPAEITIDYGTHEIVVTLSSVNISDTF